MSNKQKGAHWVKPERTEFRADPTIQEWLTSLHNATRVSYEADLYAVIRLGMKQSGTEFLASIQADPKTVSKKIKSFINQTINKYDGRNAARKKAALISFLNYHEVELPLSGLKIRRGKPPAHPLMTWETADKIINLVDNKYKPVFEIMRWGVDAERFVEANNNLKTISEVQRQLGDERNDWIRIPFNEGRKVQTDPFYVLVPREVGKYLPVRAIKNQPVKNKWNIHHQWRCALKRAGLPVNGEYGAHNLRSCWITEATKRGLDPVLRQFQLGHTVDAMNYQRITQDSKFVTEAFRKAWNRELPATIEQLQARDTTISNLTNITRTLLQDQLNEAITNLEEAQSIPDAPKSERDHWQGEVQRLQALLNSLPSPTVAQARA